MPIVDHNNAPEVPWRPNYRKWLIAQEGDGTTSTEASISEVGNCPAIVVTNEIQAIFNSYVSGLTT